MKETLGKIGIVFIIGSIMFATPFDPSIVERILFASGGVLFVLGDW